jgi:hypothetical protein
MRRKIDENGGVKGFLSPTGKAAAFAVAAFLH